MVIDCKRIAKDIKNEISIDIEMLKATGITPCLTVVIVGENPASLVYVRNKEKVCGELGIESQIIRLGADISEERLLNTICGLNDDTTVHGILVQSPLPEQINEQKVFAVINAAKDVDCFNPVNIGMLNISQSMDGLMLPCTPAGVIEILKRSNISIEGKNCVIIGRSNIVGKPMANLLLRENGTVTICHSKSKNIADICRNAEILVAAAGKKWLVRGDWIKEGAVVIDVGVNRGEGKKLYGDVHFEECAEKAGFITPVPGGVGVLTIAMLMKNCVTACKNITLRRENS